MADDGAVTPAFWTNPLRDKSDPNLHRALRAARAELEGWDEKDATRLLFRVRRFCSSLRRADLNVQDQQLLIGELEMRIGSDDLLLLIYLFRRPVKHEAGKIWCRPYSNRQVLAVLILWEAKQRDIYAARRSIFLAGELLEPDARRGKKIHDGVVAAHQIVHGTDQEKIERWESYQLHVNQLHRHNPRWSYAQIMRRVADKFGVSTKTIQRRTVSPIK